MVLATILLFLCLVLIDIYCIEIKTSTGSAAVFYLPGYSSQCGPYKLLDPNDNTVLRVDGIGVVLSQLYRQKSDENSLSNGTILLGLHRVTEADTGTYVLKYEPKGSFCQATYFSLSLKDAVPRWLNWSPWSSCTRTCGMNGVKHRQRVCSQRRLCSGDGEEQARCRLEPCQHTFWSDWSEWSSCSATCSQGRKSRRRTCSTLVGCNGPDEDHSVCKQRECKQAAWTDWSRWTVCSRTCGGGTSYRTRQCRADDVMDTCEGPNRKNRECNSQPCPQLVDEPRGRPTNVYSWTVWSTWSTCSQLCGREFRRRQRICTDDTRRPASPGFCDHGEGQESITCNHPPCKNVRDGDRSSRTADDETTSKDIGITVPLSGIVGTVAVLFIIILLVVVIILVVRLRKKNNSRHGGLQSGSSSIPTNRAGMGRRKSSNRLKKPTSISEENESHLYAEIDDEVYEKRDKSKSIVTLDNPYSDLPKSVTPTSKHPGVDDTAYYNSAGTEAQIFLFGTNTNSGEVLLNVPKSEPIKHVQCNNGGYDGGYLTCTLTSSQDRLDRQPKRYIKPKR